MADVQVDNADDPVPADAPAPEPARARRARALLRRWWPLPVAGAVAVVAWQVAADARDESAAEALRATPGVIATTVTAPLETTAVASPDLGGALYTGVRTQNGFVAGLALGAGTDPVRVVGVDPGTGEEVWRVDVAEPVDAASVGCESGTDGPARILWCWISADGDDPDAPAPATRLVEVHLGDHAVRTERDLAPGSAATVVGGTLVVGTPGEGAVHLVATDTRTGEERWAADVPAPLDPASTGGWLTRAGHHVLVSAAGGVWVVDAGTGEVQAGGVGVAVVRGDRVVEQLGTSPTPLLGTDGTGMAEADGQVQQLAPDDGSAPDVLVVEVADGSMQRLLRGVDATTGEVLWERPSDGMAPTNRLLLDGVLYGSGGTTVWAVDAATGRERWTAEGGTLQDYRLMTDGVHLLRVERDPADGAPVLAAYALGSGRSAWRTPLPPGVDSAWTQGGILYGHGADGVVVLG
jgi:outer membrane protein assembly factor BamB